MTLYIFYYYWFIWTLVECLVSTRALSASHRQLKRSLRPSRLYSLSLTCQPDIRGHYAPHHHHHHRADFTVCLWHVSPTSEDIKPHIITIITEQTLQFVSDMSARHPRTLRPTSPPSSPSRLYSLSLTCQPDIRGHYAPHHHHHHRADFTVCLWHVSPTSEDIKPHITTIITEQTLQFVSDMSARHPRTLRPTSPPSSPSRLYSLSLTCQPDIRGHYAPHHHHHHRADFTVCLWHVSPTSEDTTPHITTIITEQTLQFVSDMSARHPRTLSPTSPPSSPSRLYSLSLTCQPDIRGH